MTLGPMSIRRLTGQETFTLSGGPAGFTALDFWQWSSPELAGNTLRGVIAEFLVAQALGLAGGYRAEWARADIETPDGLLIEVKSASYLQVWAQKKPSPISFSIAPTLGWDSRTGEYETTARRQAHVYVFAVLGRAGDQSVDPLNLDAWEFLVLPVTRLNKKVGSQKTIGLKSLLQLEPRQVRYPELANAIKLAATEVI